MTIIFIEITEPDLASSSFASREIRLNAGSTQQIDGLKREPGNNQRLRKDLYLPPLSRFAIVWAPFFGSALKCSSFRERVRAIPEGIRSRLR